MRLDELTLEKYGAFPERRLDLSGPGLTVVYGPNEAGKSTSLQAVTDFLYGIPNNSTLGLFGNDAMRIGARLTTADGRRLALKRRKGRTRTLTDEAGAGVDDGVLAALLGPTDRARFTSLFGLNHETLRQGGEQLLAADGEIGRLIVEAGGGLRTLTARLDALEAEAGKLFATRRSGDRAFYQALDAFTQADAEAKRASLSRETFEEARRSHEAARQSVAALRDRRRTLAARISALERLARVAPMLGALAQLHMQLRTFADLPQVSADFDVRWPQARAARDAARLALETAEGELAELQARLDAIPSDPDILELAGAVEALADAAVLVARARQDRSNREREIAEGEAQLVSLRDRLGLGAVSELADRLPPPDALQQVQRLALEAIERRPRRRAASDRLAELEHAVAEIAAQVDSATAAGHEASWGVAATHFAGLPAQATALDVRMRQSASAAEAIAREASTLGAADADALARVRAPDLDAVTAELAAQDAMEARRTRQEDLRAAARSQMATAEAELAHLRTGAAVATDEALFQARAARDEAWAAIRNAHLAGELSASAQERGDQVQAVAQGLSSADDLADRRTTEAERVAALAQAERRQAEASQAAQAAETALKALDESWRKRAADFAEAFPDALALHPTLAGLKAYVAARAALLKQQRDQQQLAQDIERQAAELDPMLALLDDVEARAGLHLAPGASLATRVQAVSAAIERQDQARAALARGRQELAAVKTQLAAQTRTVESLKADEAAWIDRWRLAVAQIGAHPDMAVEAANALAGEWASARGVLAGLEATRRRLVRMDEDEADLSRRVVETLDALGEPGSGDAPLAAAALKTRLRRAQDLQASRGSLLPEAEALAERVRSRQAVFDRAVQAVQALAAQCGPSAGSEDLVEAMTDRLRQRRALQGEVEQLLSSIRAAGDGGDVAALSEELGEQDLDEIRGLLVAARDEMNELDGLIEAAIRAEQGGRDQLAAFERGNQVNEAVAQRESATARMHAVLERYVELKLARDLVAAAVARVRQSHQDPLIRRAGELFSKTTRGLFSGIEADIDARGEPVVVGVRAGGGTVGVGGMSDGTRDQLFLAFRLASIETYCRAAEPLPFIADDILVHFDDERSAATLDLLADFSSVTQVLLFTHHRSVLTAAEALVDTGRASIAPLTAAVPA